jgi:NAD(P)-dependent dehydrogenase (short-subunit alcohol dehydrogenase family)
MQDLFSLKGRVALVTGGSRGIGEMIAEGYVRAGAKVYISARKAAACDETARRLSDFGECISIPADASGTVGARALADLFLTRESRLDVLVNNAGAAWGHEIETFPESGWDKVMDLNVKAPFFLIQAMLGALRAGASREKPAKVINIASIDGLSVSMQDTYSYAASKAGLIHLTKRLALEMAPENIVVTAIAPGAFASNMNKTARDQGEALGKAIPARRTGTPEDMAGAAIFLASRAGDYVVGDVLVVDGGVAWTRRDLR